MFRARLRQYFDSKGFQQLIVGIIVFNSIIIGLETSPYVMDHYGHLIDQIDLVILGIFVIEMVLKLIAYRFSFFKNAWNVFDFAIIMISILPAAGSFAVFRALRILRTLRLLNNIPRLKLIIESLLHAIPSIGWIAVLLVIVYYIFGVIGTNLFGEAYPELYGSLSQSFFTLFQIMTLESWSTAIARPIMDEMPFAWLYFISFILMATYTTLNIFIAIVVNTMNELTLKELQNEEQKIEDFVMMENAKIHQKLDTLAREVQLNREEMRQVAKEQKHQLQ